VVAFVLFIGYSFGLSFLLIAVLKPIFPENVGLFVVDGVPRNFGALAAPAGAEVLGYWVIPLSLAVGLGILAASQAGARRYLSWWRSRRRAFPVLRLTLPDSAPRARVAGPQSPRSRPPSEG
jgi:hypothetical protein